MGVGARTHEAPPALGRTSHPHTWSCLRVGTALTPAPTMPEGPEHPELRCPQRLSDPQTHPKGLGISAGRWEGPPCGTLAFSSLLPAHSPHRVDVIAKLLGGLREQERRVKRLETQVGGWTRHPSPWAGPGRGHAVRAGAGRAGPGASALGTLRDSFGRRPCCSLGGPVLKTPPCPLLPLLE